MELKDRIRMAREMAKLTQQQLADKVGISRAAVSLWESGKTKEMDAKNMLKAARATKVRPEWMLFGEDPMKGDSDRKITLEEISEFLIETARIISATSLSRVEAALSYLRGNGELSIENSTTWNGEDRRKLRDRRIEQIPIPFQERRIGPRRAR